MKQQNPVSSKGTSLSMLGAEKSLATLSICRWLPWLCWTFTAQTKVIINSSWKTAAKSCPSIVYAVYAYVTCKSGEDCDSTICSRGNATSLVSCLFDRSSLYPSIPSTLFLSKALQKDRDKLIRYLTLKQHLYTCCIQINPVQVQSINRATLQLRMIISNHD